MARRHPSRPTGENEVNAMKLTVKDLKDEVTERECMRIIAETIWMADRPRTWAEWASYTWRRFRYGADWWRYNW